MLYNYPRGKCDLYRATEPPRPVIIGRPLQGTYSISLKAISSTGLPGDFVWLDR